MIETQRCMNPPKEKEKWNQLFMTMGMINKKDGTIYADLIDTFPITSINGMMNNACMPFIDVIGNFPVISV